MKENYMKHIDQRLWWIIGCTAVVLLFRISHVDMVGDDATYSVRSIGLVDFLFTAQQETPLHWFTEMPFWTELSFHDHPILLFLIQFVFLSIHASVFFAKLPFVLMALGALFFTYQWTVAVSRRKEIGLISALLLALNAQFIWAGRVSYLEAGVIFFLALTMWSFFRFLDDKKRWWQFGIVLGLTLLTKFSTLFIIPTMVLFLLWQERHVWRLPEWYWAFGLAGFINLPTIIYNLAMYRTRGHFSLQFVRLFGQVSPWTLEGIHNNLFQSLWGLVLNLGQLISWPYLLAAIVAIVFSMREKSRHGRFVLLGLFFLTIQQVFTGPGGHALAPYSILMAP
ncbi:MAG: glycosyltransferase family 39 protein, partial [Patescibacteria group bacterium]